MVQVSRHILLPFDPDVPREHVRSIDDHYRGGAARDIHRAMRAPAPSDLRGRGAVHLQPVSPSVGRC